MDGSVEGNRNRESEVPMDEIRNGVNLVFVLGLARSGTKLLRDLLNNHSKIELLECESQFLPKLYYRFRNCDLGRKNVFDRFYKVFESGVYVSNLKRRGLETINREEWYEACDAFDFGSVYRQFFEISLLGKNPHARIIGDKTPYYIYHVHLLADWFPDARFVHIVRDPRDRALSESKVWKKSLLRSAVAWRNGVEHLNAVLQGSERLLEIRYEDLLADAGGTMAQVLRFLNLELERDITNLRISSERYGDAKEKKVIRIDNCGKYRKSMTNSQIKRLEEATMGLLKYYNYPVEYATNEVGVSRGYLHMLGLYDRLRLWHFHVREKGIVAGTSYFWRI